MKRSYIFLATGFEEIEALATVDVLRRAGMDTTLVSIYEERTVTGAHGVAVTADKVFADVDFSDADWLICPGGMPGAENLVCFAPLAGLLKAHNANGGGIAAICAAPAVVLSPLGIVEGKQATCYPGFEPMLEEGGAEVAGGRVVVAGNVITGNGPASAIPFALAVAAAATGAGKAAEVADGMLV